MNIQCYIRLESLEDFAKRKGKLASNIRISLKTVGKSSTYFEENEDAVKIANTWLVLTR